METAIYVLCAITCFACATLLWRGWRESGVRLLLWSFLCFAMLTINNVLLIVDLAIVPDLDLATWRVVTGLIGPCALVYGLFLDAGNRRAGP